MTIYSTNVQLQLAAPSDSQRARVVTISRWHTDACRWPAATPETPDRVLQEALALVVLEGVSGQRQVEDWTATTIGEGLEQQRYEVSLSPTET